MLAFLQEYIGQAAKDISPSPFGRWLNGTLTAVERGSLTAEFTVREDETNPGGIMHGGVIAAIMDDMMGMTIATLDKESFYVAVNLNVDFLRPGRLGETITAVTEVIRDGRTMTHCECRLFNAEKKLLAKASSNLAQIQLKK